MKKLILFYLPDCNVSKLFEERLHKALALPEFAVGEACILSKDVAQGEAAEGE